MSEREKEREIKVLKRDRQGQREIEKDRQKREEIDRDGERKTETNTVRDRNR